MNNKKEDQQGIAINPQGNGSTTCMRDKSRKDGCEFYDRGFCRGVCYPTYPPKYKRCDFENNRNAGQQYFTDEEINGFKGETNEPNRPGTNWKVEEPMPKKEIKMTINNFDLIKDKLLVFKNPGDFYVVHVIKRAKDLKDSNNFKEGDSRESARLIKTWYIDSLEYWDKKIETIKEMARENHARAYILPCVRNRLTVNRVLAKKVIEMIDDTNCRYDHLIRTAVCGCHKTTKPWWIIDVDTDIAGPTHNTNEDAMKWLKEEFVPALVIDLQNAVSETERFASEIFVVPTANGFHVLTPPFNKAKHLNFMNPARIMSDPMTLLYYEW